MHAGRRRDYAVPISLTSFGEQRVGGLAVDRAPDLAHHRHGERRHVVERLMDDAPLMRASASPRRPTSSRSGSRNFPGAKVSSARKACPDSLAGWACFVVPISADARPGVRTVAWEASRQRRPRGCVEERLVNRFPPVARWWYGANPANSRGSANSNSGSQDGTLHRFAGYRRTGSPKSG